MPTDPLKLRIGKALREVRRRRSVDATELARRLGKLPSQIYRWERGETVAGIDQVFRYLDALDATFADFDRALDPDRVAPRNPRLRAIAEELDALSRIPRRQS